MVPPKGFATGCPLLLLVLIAACANSLPVSELKIGAVQTTVAPPVVQLANAGVKVQHVTTGAPAVKLTVPAAGKVDINAPVAVTVAPHHAPNSPPKVTTFKPVMIGVEAGTKAPNSVVAIPAGATPAAVTASAVDNSNQAPGKKLAQYFEPICKHLEQLTPEHMFKVQSQMKLFIEKTAGRMSVCFMQHYMIDPNLSPVDKTQLGNICSSQALTAGAKGSFKNFQSCAWNNWDKNLDVELDRILKLRENCFFNHGHSKNDSTISLLHDDELSLISEVVGKVLHGSNQAPVSKPNITLINLGQAPASSAGAAATTTTTTTTTTSSAASPAAGAANGATNKTITMPANNQAKANKIMNDPNTLLVFVDDTPTRVPAHGTASVTDKTNGAHPPPPSVPKAPAPALVPAPVPAPPLATALVPAPAGKEPTAAPATTSKPSTEVKLTVNNLSTSTKPVATAVVEKTIVVATTSAPKPPATTADPKLANATKVTVVVTSTEKPVASPATSTAKPPVVTVKPTAAAKSSTTAPQTTTATSATSSKPQTTPKATASTAAPATVEKLTNAKSEKDGKSKTEEDQNKAKEAIKALQKQRAGHVSDARLHQLEHDRQMTIDPKGHTEKHKKYEEMKKQRTSTKEPATSAPTTKKP